MVGVQGAVDFRHLVYFVAVAEELHFRRAAERLHIVQPALSQQIIRLEAELGVALLVRSKRHVALTDAGRVFLDDARALLAGRDRAVDAARRAAAGHTGRLDAGFVGPAAYSVLPAVVRAFRGEYPDVELSLHEHTTAEQLDMLAANTLGVGFVRLPVADDRFAVVPVLSEAMVLVLPEDHALARGEVLDLGDLAREPFVMVPRSREPTVFDRCVSLCLAAGFSPRIVQEAQQIHAIIGLVAAGLGVALVPESMSTLRRPGVAYRAVAATAGTVETGLAWRTGETAPAVRAFVRIAQELAGPAAG